MGSKLSVKRAIRIKETFNNNISKSYSLSFRFYESLLYVIYLDKQKLSNSVKVAYCTYPYIHNLNTSNTSIR